LRSFRVGLLDEAVERITTLDDLTATDVTVAGFGTIGDDAKGDQGARAGVWNRRTDRLLKAGTLAMT
jgi:hypothetical protein